MSEDVSELLEERPVRHRRIVTVTAVLTILVLAALGWKAYSWWLDMKRAALLSALGSSHMTFSAGWDSSAKAAPRMETTARRLGGMVRITVVVTNPDPLTVQTFRIRDAVVEGIKVKALPAELKNIPTGGSRALSFEVPGSFAGKSELKASIKTEFQHRDGSGYEQDDNPIPIK